jgi:hydroxymethylglutaryl-CoA lyase
VPDDPEPDVLITDVVLRDGLQDEPVLVSPESRALLGRRLLDAGLRALEVGAFVNPMKVPQMSGTPTVLTRMLAHSATADLHTLVFTERGARQAVEAGARSVRVVVSAADGHSTANAGVPTAAALERLGAATEVLREAGVTIEGCVATAFHCPFDGPVAPARTASTAKALVGLGAEVVHLADTTGAAHPASVTAAVEAVRDAVPDVPLGLHLHDTYGLAAVNAWTGFGLGVTRFDAALGGLGGCPFAPGASGNIATDDLVHLFEREGVHTGVDEKALADIRPELAELVGHPLHSAQARVGAR